LIAAWYEVMGRLCSAIGALPRYVFGSLSLAETQQAHAPAYTTLLQQNTLLDSIEINRVVPHFRAERNRRGMLDIAIRTIAIMWVIHYI